MNFSYLTFLKFIFRWIISTIGTIFYQIAVKKINYTTTQLIQKPKLNWNHNLFKRSSFPCISVNAETLPPDKLFTIIEVAWSAFEFLVRAKAAEIIGDAIFNPRFMETIHIFSVPSKFFFHFTLKSITFQLKLLRGKHNLLLTPTFTSRASIMRLKKLYSALQITPCSLWHTWTRTVLAFDFFQNFVF